MEIDLRFPQQSSAHGKLIISGEHSVVYGYPALVIESPVSVTVTLQEGQSMCSGYEAAILAVFETHTQIKIPSILITSTGSLPQKSSFGSSAAFAYAVLLGLMKAIGMNFSKKELFNLVYECEQFAHGNPSGVDPAAVVYGGVLQFQKEKGIPKWEHLPVQPAIFTPTMLIQSGAAVESTKDMIEIVSNVSHKDTLLSQIGEISSAMIHDAKNGKFQQKLITQNQRILEESGVVGQKAKQMIGMIEQVGGAAKITGGGGVVAGSGVVLAYHDDKQLLEDLVKRNPWDQIPNE